MEHAFMTEGGVDSADFLKFMGEDSGNVAESGLFSIQVAKPNQQITAHCPTVLQGACSLRRPPSCPRKRLLEASCRGACRHSTSRKHCVP